MPLRALNRQRRRLDRRHRQGLRPRRRCRHPNRQRFARVPEFVAARTGSHRGRAGHPLHRAVRQHGQRFGRVPVRQHRARMCSASAPRTNPTRRWAHSNYDATSVDLFAPGVDIKSTYPGGYASADGTSIAAAHVSGVAALVAAEHREWGAASIKAAILAGADPLANLAGKSVTGARLNAAGALEAAAEMPEIEPEPPRRRPRHRHRPDTDARAHPGSAGRDPRPARHHGTGASRRGRARGTRERAADLRHPHPAAVVLALLGGHRHDPARAPALLPRPLHAGAAPPAAGIPAGPERSASRSAGSSPPGVWRVSVAAPANASRRAFRVRVR